MRKLAAIVIAAAFVIGVSACADLPAQVQGCAPAYTAGSASKSITASGAIGTNPKVHVPTPTVTKRVEVSTLKSGKGMLLGQGDIARITLSYFSGATGASGGSTTHAKATEPVITIGETQANIPVFLGKLLECRTVGTRIAAVFTATQLYGSTKAAAAQMDPKTTIVAVEDIVSGYRGRSVGILQPPQSGFPSVVTSGNGTPGLTLDLQEPPKTLQWEVVRRGSGAKLKADDQVLLQVQAVGWTSDPPPTTTFDSTWKINTPRFYVLKPLIADAAGFSLDSGSVKALIGQTIGSQILVVVPPKYGYPASKLPSGYPSDTTLIFVYDILGKY